MDERRIIGEGRYAVVEGQEFRDRSGRLVRVTRESPNEPIPVGKAYAFFGCSASKKGIEKEIPEIRKLAATPPELELELLEGMDQLRADSRVLEIAREAQEAGLNYILDAAYPRGTNQAAADEVSAILNMMHASELYSRGEEFRGGIFYERDGAYVSRD